MKYYKIITISLLLIISLVIGYYLLVNQKDYYIEGYQAFSRSQIQDMSLCIPNSTIAIDPSCTRVGYYDTSGTISYNFFSNLPNNFYIDVCNILQPVPFGYKKTEDNKGYFAVDKTTRISQYAQSDSQNIENIISSPSLCYKSDYDYNMINPKVCYDVSYLSLNKIDNKPEMIFGRIRIPDGYYINNGIVNKVPQGYLYENPNDKTKIKMTSIFSEQISKTKYDTNNYSVQYHTEPSGNMTDSSTAGPGKMWILDNSKNLVSVPYSDVSNNTLYYEPGSFRFSSSNYVPNYEETVYLSKLTNISTVSPINNTAAMGGGFCDFYKNNPDELEKMCNDQSGNTCASTSCCVLLGGQKCVYGNESGPKFKSNYSNFLVKNPEFYYYQGKCYGNCK